MLRIVTVQQSKASVLKVFKVKPGEKLYTFCHKTLFRTQSNDDNEHVKQNDNSELAEIQNEVIDSLNLH